MLKLAYNRCSKIETNNLFCVLNNALNEGDKAFSWNYMGILLIRIGDTTSIFLDLNFGKNPLKIAYFENFSTYEMHN